MKIRRRPERKQFDEEVWRRTVRAAYDISVSRRELVVIAAIAAAVAVLTAGALVRYDKVSDRYAAHGEAHLREHRAFVAYNDAVATLAASASLACAFGDVWHVTEMSQAFGYEVSGAIIDYDDIVPSQDPESALKRARYYIHHVHVDLYPDEFHERWGDQRDLARWAREKAIELAVAPGTQCRIAPDDYPPDN